MKPSRWRNRFSFIYQRRYERGTLCIRASLTSDNDIRGVSKKDVIGKKEKRKLEQVAIDTTQTITYAFRMCLRKAQHGS